MAGVSVGTVSNVLNRPDYVSDQNRARVLQVMEEVGFVRNDLARQLRQKKSNTYGFIVLSLENPFFGALAHAGQAQAEEWGHTVVVGSSDYSKEREDRYVELFELQQVRGIVISPLDGVSQQLASTAERGTPLVLLHDADERSPYPSVYLDGVKGGRLAVEHLVERRRGRVMFAGGPMSQIVDRLTGASQATAAAGAALQVVETPDMTVADGISLAGRIASASRSERPDGIFAANDQLALGLIQGLLHSGISVPGEVAVVGFDDIPFASSGLVPLTTIRQPASEIAAAAIQLLHEQHPTISGPRQTRVRLDPELIVRQST